MPRKLLIAAIAVLSIAGYIVYFRWSSAIRQPLKFSHAQHVRQQISCETCHVKPLDDSLPAPSACLPCHKSMNPPSAISWVRVYRVAPDIIFTHEKHQELSCDTCHKEITSAIRWIHESRFKMDFCMECHDRMNAENKCGTCHKNR